MPEHDLHPDEVIQPDEAPPSVSDDGASVPDNFEDWTLLQALGWLLRSPRPAWQALMAVARTPREQAPDTDSVVQTDSVRLVPSTPPLDDAPPSVPEGPADAPPAETAPAAEAVLPQIAVARWQLGLYLLAFLVAWWGGRILLNTPVRTETTALSAGAPFLLAGLLIWLVADVFASRSAVLGWWQDQDRLSRIVTGLRLIPGLLIVAGLAVMTDSLSAPPEITLGLVSRAIWLLLAGAAGWVLIDAGHHLFGWYVNRQPSQAPSPEPVDVPDDGPAPDHVVSSDMVPSLLMRLALGLMAGLLSLVTWVGTTGNQMSGPVFFVWLASIGLWALTLAPRGWHPVDAMAGFARQVRGWGRQRGVLVALTLIVLVGAAFRLWNLEGVPPEMTSDHVEKLLDAYRVLQGDRDIFFANNGGREPFQMYAMALFSQLPGLGIDFTSLKLLAVVESLITLPVLFWMGRELVGYHDKRLGTLAGLLLAGLVAVSYWHVAITRLSLRIVLTPLVTALLLVYFSRALRFNNRADFIRAGLVLGFGLYTYQAVRMLPVVIVVGVVIAAYFAARSLADRWRYGVNLAVLVLISFVVFIPMFHYSMENPEHFWRRTTGRLLGDDVITVTQPDGSIVNRDATLEERITAFNDNVPVLMSNVRNVLLMFNWKGDVAWINGFPNHPAMDPLTGALFILGLGAWAVFMLRHRDPVLWLVPVMALIMLLPSALSIAYPIENPSHTRTSGALPLVYLMAALPLATMTGGLAHRLRGRGGKALAGGLVVVVLGGAYLANSSVYFVNYVRSYQVSSLPYTEAGGILRDFADSSGPGNAFMIAYPYWWDHRALGLNAGLPDWPNGVVRLEDLPMFLRASLARTDRYRLDPDRDILFFYNIQDEATDQLLRDWFPDGRSEQVDSYQAGDDYRLYRAPAPGASQLVALLDAADGD